jgi:hypothetical protein
MYDRTFTSPLFAVEQPNSPPKLRRALDVACHETNDETYG